MKGEGFIVGGLAALLSLNSPRYVDAGVKPSFAGSIEGYSPSGDVVDVGGTMFGGRVGMNFWYGNNYGFAGGLGFYTNTGNQRGEFSTFSGRLREGERERAEAVRVDGGLIFGDKPSSYVTLGGAVVEIKNLFESTDTRFLRQEFSQFVDRETFYGPSLSVNLGGRINKRIGAFFRFGLDYLFNNKYEKPITAVNFGAGINFTAP